MLRFRERFAAIRTMITTPTVEPTEDEKRARQEGFAAWFDDWHDNPYASGSMSAKAWELGQEDALTHFRTTT